MIADVLVLIVVSFLVVGCVASLSFVIAYACAWIWQGVSALFRALAQAVEDYE